jgi:hypothetical protein
MELSKSRWKTAIRKNELNAINTSELNGMVTDLANQFGIFSLPTCILINESGYVVKKAKHADILLK